MSNSEFPETRTSLLLGLQTGDDQDAWHEFASVYSPIIYRISRKHGLQDADAHDLVQQILVSVAGAIDQYQKKDETVRFRHWLKRIARNAIYNALTRRPHDRGVGGTSVHEALNNHVFSEERLEREIESEHQRELFLRAASIVKSQVTHNSWQIFHLTVVNGRSVQEVSRELNKSVGSIYAVRGRVMAKIRGVLHDLEQAEP
ncbi:MAG: sigma-70 family RNA polymerase sigma factor [Planctomycetota bacterium]